MLASPTSCLSLRVYSMLESSTFTLSKTIPTTEGRALVLCRRGQLRGRQLACHALHTQETYVVVSVHATHMCSMFIHKQYMWCRMHASHTHSYTHKHNYKIHNSFEFLENLDWPSRFGFNLVIIIIHVNNNIIHV